MAKTINVKHIHEVFSDEAFVKELLSMEAPEDAQAALKAKGVEFTIEELKGISNILSVKISEGGELSLDDLDNAAGGIDPVTVSAALLVLTVLGAIGVAGVGGAAVGAIAVLRRW